MGEDDTVVLRRGASRCEVTKFGAHVSAWTLGDGMAQLFMSSASEPAPKPLRGGIPICWPQFANRGPGSKHGFARTSGNWKVLTVTSDGPNPTVTFELTDDESTPAVFPHKFRCLYHVTLPADKTLSCALQVINTGDTPMEFTVALHTYFAASSVKNVGIVGLQGVTYEDSAADPDPTSGKKPLVVEAAETVGLSGEVDRIYYNSPNKLLLQDGDSSLAILSQGFTDTVVWNIGEEKAHGLKDLGEGEWDKYVCIESAVIGKPVKLEPMRSWLAGVSYTAK